MNDFLTEKNKKTGVLGKLKWVLCGFCILFTLGAIGAAEKYIGEGRWGMAATEIILGLLFLYPTFREIQKALKKKKAREIACWFESYAQSTLSFEKFETEMGKDAVRKLEKMIAKGYIRNIQIDREENYILITAPNRRVKTYTNRLKQLEDITNQFKGVEKSFAIQAGREIRVMVVPEHVNDSEMVLLARDIAKQIEAELEYPGQIKVNVIRESRAVDYAK